MTHVWPPKHYNSSLTLFRVGKSQLSSMSCLCLQHLLENPWKWVMGLLHPPRPLVAAAIARRDFPIQGKNWAAVCLRKQRMSGRQADTTHNQAGMHLRMEFGRENWKGETAGIEGAKSWFLSCCFQKEGDISGGCARVFSTWFSFLRARQSSTGTMVRFNWLDSRKKCSQLPRRSGWICWMRAGTTHHLCSHAARITVIGELIEALLRMEQ